jgi:heme exporter protein A
MTIEIKNLGLKRGTKWLYEGVNLQLEVGDILVLRGPNGSGKSSLLRALAGFLPLEDGQIYYHHHPAQLSGSGRNIKTCWYGQNDGLTNEFTARQNLHLMASIHNATHHIDQILHEDLFGLSDFLDRQTQQLSTGQRQRLALSCLRFCAGAPYLWLLDEPNSGLDRAGQNALCRLLGTHQSQQGISLIASHIPLSDRLDHKIFDLQKAEA